MPRRTPSPSRALAATALLSCQGIVACVQPRDPWVEPTRSSPLVEIALYSPEDAGPTGCVRRENGRIDCWVNEATAPRLEVVRGLDNPIAIETGGYFQDADGTRYVCFLYSSGPGEPLCRLFADTYSVAVGRDGRATFGLQSSALAEAGVRTNVPVTFPSPAVESCPIDGYSRGACVRTANGELFCFGLGSFVAADGTARNPVQMGVLDLECTAQLPIALDSFEVTVLGCIAGTQPCFLPLIDVVPERLIGAYVTNDTFPIVLSSAGELVSFALVPYYDTDGFIAGYTGVPSLLTTGVAFADFVQTGIYGPGGLCTVSDTQAVECSTVGEAPCPSNAEDRCLALTNTRQLTGLDTGTAAWQ